MGNQVYYPGFPNQGNPYMYYQNPIMVNPNMQSNVYLIYIKFLVYKHKWYGTKLFNNK